MRDLKKALLSAVTLLGLLLFFAWANRAGVLTSEAARSVIDAAGPLGPVVLGFLYATTCPSRELMPVGLGPRGQGSQANRR
jgi:uncharacterized membrane protein YdjX (TVP38/TMEM64 family)